MVKSVFVERTGEDRHREDAGLFLPFREDARDGRLKGEE
jgi:hypothetical protein